MADHEDRKATTRERDRTDEGGLHLDEGGYDEDHARAGRGSSLPGESLIALLLVAGAILFLFPEPSTSAIGAVMVALGVIAWVADVVR